MACPFRGVVGPSVLGAVACPVHICVTHVWTSRGPFWALRLDAGDPRRGARADGVGGRGAARFLNLERRCGGQAGDLANVLFVERLAREERFRQFVERATVLGEEARRVVMALGDDL